MSAPDESTVGTAEVRLARMEAQLGYIREELSQMRETLVRAAESSVPRGEWVQRNNLVDSRFEAHGREIGQLRTALAEDRAQRKGPPWTAVASSVVAVAALVLTLVQSVA